MDTIALEDAFESIDEYWSPQLAGEVNGQAVKLAKTNGEFVWHQHDDADEFFLVTSGQLRIEFRDQEDVTLNDGEMGIVPRETEHRPVAEPEAHILLFEPTETVNTGSVEEKRTQGELETID